MNTPTGTEQAAHRDHAHGALLLYRDGEDVAAYRRDAENLARVMGWIHSYTETGEEVMVFASSRLDHILHKLVAARFRVAILEPITVAKLARNVVPTRIICRPHHRASDGACVMTQAGSPSDEQL